MALCFYLWYFTAYSSNEHQSTRKQSENKLSSAKPTSWSHSPVPYPWPSSPTSMMSQFNKKKSLFTSLTLLWCATPYSLSAPWSTSQGSGMPFTTFWLYCLPNTTFMLVFREPWHLAFWSFRYFLHLITVNRYSLHFGSFLYVTSFSSPTRHNRCINLSFCLFLFWPNPLTSLFLPLLPWDCSFGSSMEDLMAVISSKSSNTKSDQT